MKEVRQITCIVCPMGCQLIVEIENGAVTKVEGNQCKRGAEYAKSECVHPVRTLTTTVRTINAGPLPVKSGAALPKDKLFDCMAVLQQVTATTPISIGTVIVADICNTGIDIVATADKGLE